MRGYGRYLLGWHVLQSRVESLLEQNAVEQLLPDWPRRRRAHLVAQDIAASGGRAPHLGVRAAPPLDAAGVLGTAYVVEGATLGASVLLPRFLERGVATEANSTFLAACAVASVETWPSFLETLRRFESEVSPDAVVEAAERTFAWAREAFLRPVRPQARLASRPSSP